MRLKEDNKRIWAENEKMIKYIDELKGSQGEEVDDLKRQIDAKESMIEELNGQIL